MLKCEVNNAAYTTEVLDRRLVIYPALLRYGRYVLIIHILTTLRGHV